MEHRADYFLTDRAVVELYQTLKKIKYVHKKDGMDCMHIAHSYICIQTGML